MQPHGTFPQLSCQSIRNTDIFDIFKLGEAPNFHRLSIEKGARVKLHCTSFRPSCIGCCMTDLSFGLVKSATDKTEFLRCDLQAHFAVPLQKRQLTFSYLSFCLEQSSSFLREVCGTSCSRVSLTFVNTYRFFIKVKVKLTLEHAMKTQSWREKRIALFFL